MQIEKENFNIVGFQLFCLQNEDCSDIYFPLYLKVKGDGINKSPRKILFQEYSGQ